MNTLSQTKYFLLLLKVMLTVLALNSLVACGSLSSLATSTPTSPASITVTGITDAVAESIVDLGIDWSDIETLHDLQTGLTVALSNLGVRLGKV